MKVPFFWIGTGYAAGILCSKLIFFPVSILPVALLLICFIFLWYMRGHRLFLWIFVIWLFCLGGMKGSLRILELDHQAKAWAFLQAREGNSSFSILEGKVISLPQRRSQNRRCTLSFVVQAHQIKIKEKGYFKTLDLQGQVQVFIFYPSMEPSFGDQVKVYGDLESPKPAKNPGEFDYAAYLKNLRIYAVMRGYGKSIRILSSANTSLVTQLACLRKKIQDRIRASFDSEHGSVFLALITGDQKNISDRLRDDFSKTGTSHLLAVSGLNITLVAGSFYGLMLLFRMKQKAAALASFLVMVFYALIAGWGAPVVRAAWMSGAAFVAILLERNRNTLNAFFLSLFVLILLDPGSIYAIGFQLSFLSVLGLLLMSGRFPKMVSWMELARGTCAAMIFTFPFVIHYFHIFSISAFAANLLAIPIFHLALLFGLAMLIALWIPGLAFCFKIAAQGFLKIGLIWIHQLAMIPYTSWHLPSPETSKFIFYYGILLLIWGVHRYGILPFGHQAPWQWKKIRDILCGFWILCWLSFFWVPKFNGVELTFFSSGQSSMIYFSTQSGRHYLINSGRSFPSNQARWILEPFLRSHAVHVLHGIFLTDDYAKHTGGIHELGNNFKVLDIFCPDSLRLKLIQTTRAQVTQVISDLEYEIESGIKVRWHKVSSRSNLFLLDIEGQQVLYLPKLSSDIFAYLQKNWRDFTRVQWLVIEEVQNISGEKMDTLLEYLDPSLIVVSRKNNEINLAAQMREISTYSLEEKGGLSIRIKSSDSNENTGGNPMLHEKLVFSSDREEWSYFPWRASKV